MPLARSGSLRISIVKCTFLILLLYRFAILPHLNCLRRFFLLSVVLSRSVRLGSSVQLVRVAQPCCSFLRWSLSPVFCLAVRLDLSSRKGNCLRLSGSRRRCLEALHPVDLLSLSFLVALDLIAALGVDVVRFALGLWCGGGRISGRTRAERHLLGDFFLIGSELICQLIRLLFTTPIDNIHVYI